MKQIEIANQYEAEIVQIVSDNDAERELVDECGYSWPAAEYIVAEVRGYAEASGRCIVLDPVAWDQDYYEADDAAELERDTGLDPDDDGVTELENGHYICHISAYS